jgi:tRNA-Thr(GGU) m(6)t(6)A37 methyltransferase TsaA
MQGNNIVKVEDSQAMEFNYKPIGVIHSQFKEVKGTPIQPTGAKGIKGVIEIEPEYRDGLKDLNEFSHIILLYHFHLAEGYSLQVRPYLDTTTHGVFATRIPGRPNPIGLSIVRLVKIEDCTIHIQDVDIIDCTPLLDIKPYVPAFDLRETKEIGWLKGKEDKVFHIKSDGRLK